MHETETGTPDGDVKLKLSSSKERQVPARRVANRSMIPQCLKLDQ